jgi:hypothetical protein
MPCRLSALAERRPPPSVLTWWQLEGAPPPPVEAVGAAYGPAPGSLALMSGSRPLSGDANESLPVTASVLGPWLLLWGRNRSSVCIGTLNAGVLFVAAVGA